MKNSTSWFALCLAVVLSAGCATSSSQNNQLIPEPLDPIIARPDGAVRVDTGIAEVAKLWAASETAREQGQAEVALELLYEALEIDGSNSLLWSRAAELQLDVVEPALAEKYAMRSNTSASENRQLLYRNWLIIEHARSMRGDLLGVRSARKQVQLYRYQ